MNFYCDSPGLCPEDRLWAFPHRGDSTLRYSVMEHRVFHGQIQEELAEYDETANQVIELMARKYLKIGINLLE